MKGILFLLLLSTPVLGQVGDSTTAAPFPLKSNFRSSILFEGGLSSAFISLPAIRSFFRENSIKADPRSSLFIGTGLGYRRQRFKLAMRFEWGVDSAPTTSTDSSYVARRQNITNFYFMLGYDIANTRNRRVFINAGIGNIRYEYTVFRPGNQVVPFQTIFQHSAPGSIPSLVLYNGCWDINLEITGREKRRDSFQFLQRIGYRRGIRGSAWTSDAYQITGGPVDRLNQLYVQGGFNASRSYTKRSKQ